MNTPLAPEPSKAKEIATKAKWYHIVTENILVSTNSNIIFDKLIKKIPNNVRL